MGIMQDQSVHELPAEAGNSSSGMGIEIFWRYCLDFGHERRVCGGEEWGGVIEGDRSREDVVGGGYGEEIAGCDEEISGV